MNKTPVYDAGNTAEATTMATSWPQVKPTAWFRFFKGQTHGPKAKRIKNVTEANRTRNMSTLYPSTEKAESNMSNGTSVFVTTTVTFTLDESSQVMTEEKTANDLSVIGTSTEQVDVTTQGVATSRDTASKKAWPTTSTDGPTAAHTTASPSATTTDTEGKPSLNPKPTEAVFFGSSVATPSQPNPTSTIAVTKSFSSGTPTFMQSKDETVPSMMIPVTGVAIQEAGSTFAFGSFQDINKPLFSEEADYSTEPVTLPSISASAQPESPNRPGDSSRSTGGSEQDTITTSLNTYTELTSSHARKANSEASTIKTGTSDESTSEFSVTETFSQRAKNDEISSHAIENGTTLMETARSTTEFKSPPGTQQFTRSNSVPVGQHITSDHPGAIAEPVSTSPTITVADQATATVGSADLQATTGTARKEPIPTTADHIWADGVVTTAEMSSTIPFYEAAGTTDEAVTILSKTAEIKPTGATVVTPEIMAETTTQEVPTKKGRLTKCNCIFCQIICPSKFFYVFLSSCVFPKGANGTFGEWSMFTSCSGTCKGTKTRNRTCTYKRTPTVGPRDSCEGNTVEVVACGAKHCPSKNEVDFHSSLCPFFFQFFFF